MMKYKILSLVALVAMAAASLYSFGISGLALIMATLCIVLIVRRVNGHGIKSVENLFTAVKSIKYGVQRPVFCKTKIYITPEEKMLARNYLEMIFQTGGEMKSEQKTIYIEQGILPSEGNSITDEHINRLYARLLQKRAKVFYTEDDVYVLRDETRGTGCPGHVDPREYLLYSEMELGALMQVAGDTRFINDGRRRNLGEKYNKSNQSTGSPHEQYGFIAGLVGARLEINDGMEALHFKLGNKTQAIETYRRSGNLGRISGVNDDFVRAYGKMWDNFYKKGGCEHSVSPGVFNSSRLEYRLYLSYKKFFASSVNSCSENQKAYIRVVGLGDGAWAGGNAVMVKQAIGRAVARVVRELSQEQKRKICAVEFSQFEHEDYYKAYLKSMKEEKPGAFAILSSQSAPFAHEINKKLYPNAKLCVNFAWDAGSWVGNEYWCGLRSASGDPAAVCCSGIKDTFLPERNPTLPKSLECIGDTTECFDSKTTDFGP